MKRQHYIRTVTLHSKPKETQDGEKEACGREEGGERKGRRRRSGKGKEEGKGRRRRGKDKKEDIRREEEGCMMKEVERGRVERMEGLRYL